MNRNTPEEQREKVRQRELGILPEEVPLRSDLWPSIAAAIEADKRANDLPVRRRPWVAPAAIAAAMSFIALGFFLGRAPVEPAMDVVVVDERGARDFIAVSMGPDYPALREQLWKSAVPAL